MKDRRLLLEDNIERIFVNIREIMVDNNKFLVALKKVESNKNIPMLERGWGEAFYQHVC